MIGFLFQLNFLLLPFYIKLKVWIFCSLACFQNTLHSVLRGFQINLVSLIFLYMTWKILLFCLIANKQLPSSITEPHHLILYKPDQQYHGAHVRCHQQDNHVSPVVVAGERTNNEGCCGTQRSCAINDSCHGRQSFRWSL